MTQTLLLSSILLLSQTDTDPAERLVRAEVLEVAKGDLEKAMAEYRAIEGDEKAPASVRARALLALGRCQRKRGELEAARRTFADLLARHADEKETARRAKGFLDEIEKGRSENPDFDWLGDLEKSPEIQARVFELAMQAAGPDTNDAVTVAVRQLLALGRAALPVLDKVIEVSGDRQHRRRLASIELHAGRFDRLALALEGGFPVPWVLQRFMESIPAFPEERRRSLVAELDKASQVASTELGHFVRLWAGDVSQVREALPTLRKNPVPKELAVRIAGAGSAGVEALALLVLDPKGSIASTRVYSASVNTERTALVRLCFEVLQEMKPDALTDDLWVARLEAGTRDTQEAHTILRDMESQGRFAALERLARGSQANTITNLFWNRYGSGNDRKGDDVKAADPRWARILRAAKSPGTLSFLAANRDDALPEYAGFLQNREYGDATDIRAYPFQGSTPPEEASSWVPSEAYLRTMVALLDHGDGKVVLVAIEALSKTALKRIDAAVPRMEQLARESPDVIVRYRAIAALLTLLSQETERAKTVVLIWIEEAERDQNPGRQDVSAGPKRRRGMTPSMQDSKTRMKHVITQVLSWIPDGVALYSAVLGAANERGAAQFHDVYWETRQDLSTLIELLGEVTHPELMASVLDILRKNARNAQLDGSAYDAESRARILPFLERLTRERGARVEVRTHAWVFAGYPPEWFDWPALLASDDPLAGRLSALDGTRKQISTLFDSLPEEKQITMAVACLRSPLEEVRKFGVELPLESAKSAEVVRDGLNDRALSVRQAALTKLDGLTRGDAAPALSDLLRHPDRTVRYKVLEALTRFADPASIEPMIALLDDPDVEVRSKALEGVKEIQRVLGEKRQWKDWARRVKAGENPPPDFLEKK